jgi:SAM-dependent methyltransferase
MTQSTINVNDFKTFESSAHDEIAEGYRDFFGKVTGYAVEPLLGVASVGMGTSVLDVATGPGILASRAADRGAFPVIGVDLAPQMVAMAAAQYPRIDFRQADAESLPFPDRSFDAVLCNFGIGHFPQPELAVGEFARVAAPGGFVALSWWDVPARHRLNGIFFDAVSEAQAPPPAGLPAGPPMFRFSEDRELETLLKSVGLTAVTIEAHCFTHRLASAEQLWNGILQGTVRTSIGIRRQPKDVQDRIRVAFERLVGPYMVEGELLIPVAFKIGVGRRQPA